MHTLFDGRKYVGITCTKPEKRWRKGRGYQGNSYFWNTIQKYGWDSFKHEILFEGLTLEQACNKEKALIKLFSTTDSRYGFNLTTGGEHFEHSEKTKEKLSAINRKFYISKEELYYQYIVLDKTQEELVILYGCSRTVIEKFLKKYKICKDKVHISEEDLYYQYVVLKKLISELMDHFGCSESTIYKFLNTYNIEKRGRFLLPISREDLYYQYIILNKTMQQCADYFKCHRNTISALLKQFKIKKEKVKESSTKICISYDDLAYQFIALKSTQTECAVIFGCSRATIKRSLVAYGLL